eukprot:s4835_g14.t1
MPWWLEERILRVFAQHAIGKTAEAKKRSQNRELCVASCLSFRLVPGFISEASKQLLRICHPHSARWHSQLYTRLVWCYACGIIYVCRLANVVRVDRTEPCSSPGSPDLMQLKSNRVS